MTQKVLSNKIILGILDEFKANYEFGETSESKLFEKLVNYVTFSKYDPEAFSDVSTFDLVDVDRESTFASIHLLYLLMTTLYPAKKISRSTAKQKEWMFGWCLFRLKGQRHLTLANSLNLQLL